MAQFHISRRTMIAALGALTTAPSLARADQAIEIGWSDLLPEGSVVDEAQMLSGFVPHESATLVEQQPPSSGVRTDWNGKTVSLPGYIVPINYEGTKVTDFILVPYVGACIHVPPPPANQLVLVTADRPYEMDGLFEAVEVTGKIGTTPTTTDLADIGYVMKADRVRAYG
jgi:hypothetical protein